MRHDQGSGERNVLDTEQREGRQLVQELLATQSKVNELEQRLAEQKAIVHQIYSSTSWRVTAPLRAVSRCGRGLVQPRTSLKAILARIAALAVRYPRAREATMSALSHFPGLREKLRSIVLPTIDASLADSAYDYAEAMTEERLPPSARRVFAELVFIMSSENRR